MRGLYGCSKTEIYLSNFCVCTSGCTDEELFQKLISLIYLPHFPNCFQKVERGEHIKLLQAPIIIKTDSVQERLAVSIVAVKFYEAM